MKQHTVLMLKNYTFPKIQSSNFSSNTCFISDSHPLNQPSNNLKHFIQSQSPQNLNFSFQLYSFINKQKLHYRVNKLPHFLTILTYNIWFGEHNKNIRYECILKMLEQSNADFICLQEVTQEFVKLLQNTKKNNWIGNYFTAATPMNYYDTVILSKYECKFYKKPFESTTMQRNMLFAEIIEQNGNNVIVGCIHFESLSQFEKIRKQQIETVEQMVKQCPRVIIAGDYNIYDEDTKAMQKQFTDLWLKVHKDSQNGYTMPQSLRYPSSRPDRILIKVPSYVDLSLAQIEKFGQFTIPPFQKDQPYKVGIDDIVRTPSDHYGLIAYIPLI